MDAKQTPLIDLLERVPADARMVYEHDQYHSQNIPVGRLCHEAAAALRAALEQPEQEPVGWRAQNATPPGGFVIFQQYPQALADLGGVVEPLYTHPAGGTHDQT
jgi:hypothetical protein